MVQKTEMLIDWMINNYEKILAKEGQRRFHNQQKCDICKESSLRLSELKQMRQTIFDCEKQEEEQAYRMMEEQRRQEEQKLFEEWKASQSSPAKNIKLIKNVVKEED